MRYLQFYDGEGRKLLGCDGYQVFDNRLANRTILKRVRAKHLNALHATVLDSKKLPPKAVQVAIIQQASNKLFTNEGEKNLTGKVSLT